VEIARSHRDCMLVAVFGLVGSATTLAMPALLGRAIDDIFRGGSMRWAAIAVAIIALAVVADLVDTFASASYSARATASLRQELVRRVLTVAPHRFLAFSLGDLVGRVSARAPEAAQATLSRITLWLGLLPPLGSLVLLALMDYSLAIAFLGGVGLVALILRSFSRATMEATSAYQLSQGSIAGRLAEALSGARTIAAAGTLGLERERVLKPMGELSFFGVRMWRVLARSSAQAAVAGPLVLVAVLAAGGLVLTAGQISPGELFAAGRYAVLGAGLGSLTGVIGALARARAAGASVGEILDRPPLTFGRVSTSDGEGRLSFEGVGVRGLLHGIDLDLPAGAAIAVVGRSGAGKSVLAALAARLRDPDSGRVLLDGVPLPSLSEAALRASIGCAFERPNLFLGTPAESISLGRKDFPVMAAAQAARAHDFIARLPHGYDTPIAQAPMSGGEAQRLGLARAWSARRLLVLDDATSSLDMVTEREIAATLLAEGRTRLIVTHRVTTAERADVVVWLDNGRVRGAGPHAMLCHDPGYRAVFS